MKTAILIDGGFYRKRARVLWGEKTPDKRANELMGYCYAHLAKQKLKSYHLYRIFYYDCHPLDNNVFHPLLKRNIDWRKEDIFSWSNDFFEELKTKRKVALRLGRLSKNGSYSLKLDAQKSLLDGEKSIADLTVADFTTTFTQKGVDMRIGVDIASMTFKKQVDQIILIAGDSDFVPAAKLARREGIDFILDPMWQHIPADLFEHIDGLTSPWKESAKAEKELLKPSSLIQDDIPGQKAE